MFSEQNEQVNIRQLRDGKVQDAVLDGLRGSQLRLRLLGNAFDESFASGELVEVSAARALYLGEITSRRGDAVLIFVEHALDREALAAINEVWHRPEGA